MNTHTAKITAARLRARGFTTRGTTESKVTVSLDGTIGNHAVITNALKSGYRGYVMRNGKRYLFVDLPLHGLVFALRRHADACR